MFWLKKFVGFWLMPLPLCLTLLVVGWCLSFSRPRRTLSRWLIGTATALLLLFSNKAFSTWLVRPLETEFAPVPELTSPAALPPELARCRYVVVLGGGHGDTVRFAAINKLSTSGQARLLEGVRIARALPEAKLVLCGPAVPGGATHASVLATAAESLGIPRSRLIELPDGRDTEGEAIEIGKHAGAEPFALVTSAWHMRRAVAVMRAAGRNPVPCPCDYAARPSAPRGLDDYGWDTESVGRSTRGIYERIGYLWSKLRRKA